MAEKLQLKSTPSTLMFINNSTPNSVQLPRFMINNKKKPCRHVAAIQPPAYPLLWREVLSENYCCDKEQEVHTVGKSFVTSPFV